MGWNYPAKKQLKLHSKMYIIQCTYTTYLYFFSVFDFISSENIVDIK